MKRNEIIEEILSMVGGKEELINFLNDLKFPQPEELIDGYVFKSMPLKVVLDYLHDLGWKDDDYKNDDFTNGWQVDFFWYMRNPEGKLFFLRGSLMQDEDVKLIEVDEED